MMMRTLGRIMRYLRILPVAIALMVAQAAYPYPGQSEENDSMEIQAVGSRGEASLLTMDFKDADLRNVLRLIAEQNGLNVIAGPEITGMVTVRLQGVTVDEALRNILKSNGFAYVRDENVILVQPEEENPPAMPRETRVYTLQWVDGTAIKPVIEAILSEGGKAQTFSRTTGDKKPEGGGRSDVIIVSDKPPVLLEVDEIIERIDVPEPQVMIEARIIETIYTKDDRVGIAWPNTFQFLYSKLSLEEKYQSNSGGSGTSEQIGSAFEWGRLSVRDFQAAIDILSQQRNSKLISNPRITTLNNQEAEIGVTTSVPILTVNRFSFAAEAQDVATYEYIDIGITLKVTPRVNEGHAITLEVAPTIEEISGFTGPVASQVPITTKRSTVTNVRVEDGETIVIGGLLKDDRAETITKLWFLGDIPILGRLFRHKALQETKSDLIIFITPHIIQS